MTELFDENTSMEDIVLAATSVEEELSPEELAIDETLSPIEKLNFYINSDLVLHRLFVIKEMRNVMETCDASLPDIIDCIKGKLRLLTTDIEPIIRENFAFEFPNIISFFIPFMRSNVEAYDLVESSMMECLTHLVFDEPETVRIYSVDAIVKICDALELEYQEKVVCAFVDRLLTYSDVDRGIVTALDLMRDLSECIDASLIISRFLPILNDCHRSLNFLIRQKTVDSLASISSALDPFTVTDVIVPMLKDLLKDSMWGVRKVIADLLPEFSMHVTSKCREEELTPLCMSLLSDSSRWVVSAVHDTLGGFIATFGLGLESTSGKVQPIFQGNEPENVIVSLPENLIAIYIDAMTSMDSEVRENEKLIQYAYFLPGVVVALGKDNWPRVKEIYNNLALDVQWKVRKPIAASLHIVAKALGADLTVTDLLPILDQFLKDLDEVKVSVMEHFSDILRIVEPEHREIYLTVLNDMIQQSGHNWRIRYIIADHIRSLCGLYKSSLCSQFLFPLACKLSKDQVAEVRYMAKEAFGAILENLRTFEEDSSLKEDFVERVLEFKENRYYGFRIMYVEMVTVICKHFAHDVPEIEKLLSPLCDLVNDPVVNVRIALARALALELSVYEPFKSMTLIHETCSKLTLDKSRDIIVYFQKISPINDDVSDSLVVDRKLSMITETTTGTGSTTADNDESPDTIMKDEQPIIDIFISPTGSTEFHGQEQPVDLETEKEFDKYETNQYQSNDTLSNTILDSEVGDDASAATSLVFTSVPDLMMMDKGVDVDLPSSDLFLDQQEQAQ